MEGSGRVYWGTVCFFLFSSCIQAVLAGWVGGCGEKGRKRVGRYGDVRCGRVEGFSG